MIDTLLLDLGGVILDINKDECIWNFKHLGFKAIDTFLGDYAQKGPFSDLEAGKLSPDEFRGALRAMMDTPLSDSVINEAFGSFLLSIPIGRLRQLERLRGKYRIFLLSNTNPIMWDDYIARAFRIDGHDREYYFDGVLTSFEAGCNKPAPEIFRRAIEKFGLVPENTLFCDDSLANCREAAKFGIQTRHIADGVTFGDNL